MPLHEYIPKQSLKQRLSRLLASVSTSRAGLENSSYSSLGFDHQKFRRVSLGLETETNFLDSRSRKLRLSFKSLGLKTRLIYIYKATFHLSCRSAVGASVAGRAHCRSLEMRGVYNFDDTPFSLFALFQFTINPPNTLPGFPLQHQNMKPPEFISN